MRPVASLLDDNRLPTQLARVAVGGLAVLGLAKLAVHLLTNATLDFHRDELYYLASGRHLALGYVDYPPLSPVLARLSLAQWGERNVAKVEAAGSKPRLPLVLCQAAKG